MIFLSESVQLKDNKSGMIFFARVISFSWIVNKRFQPPIESERQWGSVEPTNVSFEVKINFDVLTIIFSIKFHWKCIVASNSSRPLRTLMRPIENAFFLFSKNESSREIKESPRKTTKSKEINMNNRNADKMLWTTIENQQLDDCVCVRSTTFNF